MPKPTRRDRRSFWSVPSLSSWTVSTVRTAVDAHERGDFAASALLAEAMERNPRVYSALDTRVKGAAGLPFSFEVDEKAPPTRGAAELERVREMWPRVCPEQTVKDLLRWASTMGFALAEVAWSTVGGVWEPRLRAVHPYWVSWSELDERFEVQTRDGIVPVEPGDGWLLFGYAGERPWMRGVVRCLALEDHIRSLAVRDWARWSEVHGMPIRGAKVPASASEEDKDRFFEDISALGNESTVMLPQGDTPGASFGVELVEARTAEASKGFQALLSEVASDIAIALLGQNLTTQVTGGSLAAAKVHDRVRQDYLEDDTETLSTALREQVLVPWARFNTRGGDARLAPWPRWNAATPEDREAMSRVMQTAGNAIATWNSALAAAGSEVDVLALAERFGVPVRATKRTE